MRWPTITGRASTGDDELPFRRTVTVVGISTLVATVGWFVWSHGIGSGGKGGQDYQVHNHHHRHSDEVMVESGR